MPDRRRERAAKIYLGDRRESGHSGQFFRRDAPMVGKVAIVSGALAIDADDRGATIGGMALREGDRIALDGASGEITFGRQKIAFAPAPESETVMEWRKEGDARP